MFSRNPHQESNIPHSIESKQFQKDRARTVCFLRVRWRANLWVRLSSQKSHPVDLDLLNADPVVHAESCPEASLDADSSWACWWGRQGPQTKLVGGMPNDWGQLLVAMRAAHGWTLVKRGDNGPLPVEFIEGISDIPWQSAHPRLGHVDGRKNG